MVRVDVGGFKTGLGVIRDHLCGRVVGYRLLRVIHSTDYNKRSLVTAALTSCNTTARGRVAMNLRG